MFRMQQVLNPSASARCSAALRTVVLALALIPPLSAQGTESRLSLEHPQAASAVIWGTVTDLATNRPVGAEVSIVHNQAPHRRFFHARAGLDGAFEARSLPPGKTIVVAWAEGFAYQSQEVILAKGGVRVDFRLLRAARLQGTVTDENGQPLEGAVVRAVYPEGPAILFGWQRQEASSDENGLFTLSGLNPDAEFYLEAKQARFAVAFSPAPLLLAPGEDVEAAPLRLRPGSRVSGQIVDEDGRPVAYSEVLLLARQLPLDPTGGKSPALREEALVRTSTDGSGHFQIEGLSPGARTLIVRHPEWKDWSQPLSLQGRLQDIDLRVTLKEPRKPR